MKEERWNLTVKTSDGETSIWGLAKIMQKTIIIIIKATIYLYSRSPQEGVQTRYWIKLKAKKISSATYCALVWITPVKCSTRS